MALDIPERSWIVAVTEDNYGVCIRNGIIGMKYRGLASKVNIGDGIIFYIKGRMELRDLWKIKGRWVGQDKPLWPDEVKEKSIIYKYRAEIEPLVRGVTKVEKLINELSFIKNKGKWSLYFIGELANLRRPIPRDDVKKIILRMRGEMNE